MRRNALRLLAPYGLIAAEADGLVSGDNDLLALREEYCIENPAEFVLRL